MPMKRREPATPPPVIGKIGPYTVFMTPPPTPNDPSAHQPAFEPPRKVVAAPPPVRAPHQHIDSSAIAHSDGSLLGFLRNAVSSVQNAHSSLDDHLARWFGLNQSKYQWALDDYYESKGLENSKGKDVASKMQMV